MCIHCRRTQNSNIRAQRHYGTSNPPELSLVEFCQLVDFLLDIVSLVSLSFFLSFFFFCLSFHFYVYFILSFSLSHFYLDFFFTLSILSVLLCLFSTALLLSFSFLSFLPYLFMFSPPLLISVFLKVSSLFLCLSTTFFLFPVPCVPTFAWTLSLTASWLTHFLLKSNVFSINNCHVHLQFGPHLVRFIIQLSFCNGHQSGVCASHLFHVSLCVYSLCFPTQAEKPVR